MSLGKFWEVFEIQFVLILSITGIGTIWCDLWALGNTQFKDIFKKNVNGKKDYLLDSSRISVLTFNSVLGGRIG